jgi:hypothetical protein
MNDNVYDAYKRTKVMAQVGRPNPNHSKRYTEEAVWRVTGLDGRPHLIGGVLAKICERHDFDLEFVAI